MFHNFQTPPKRGNLQLSVVLFVDVHFQNYGYEFLERRRKLVGMRPGTKSLHLWNGRVKSIVANTYASTRYCILCKNGWTFPRYVANLPAHRWVQRLLSRHPFGARSVGRPRTRRESNFRRFFLQDPLFHRHWCIHSQETGSAWILVPWRELRFDACWMKTPHKRRNGAHKEVNGDEHLCNSWIGTRSVWIPGAHWKGFADGARVKGHELDRCVSSNVSPLFHLSQFRCPSRPKITGTFLWMALFLDYGCCLFVLFPGFPTLHLNTLTLSLHKSWNCIAKDPMLTACASSLRGYRCEKKSLIRRHLCKRTNCKMYYTDNWNSAIEKW